MYTDWLLVRRLALELEQRFKGARVRDAGRLEDGRFALALWRRGMQSLLCADVFASTPLLTVESGELPIAVEPGFVRAAGSALRGSSVASVASRRGDRLIRIEFGARSRFGVEDRVELVFELIPRFGNIILVKGGVVVAALKEFAAGENSIRSVQAGALYEPPPLRAGRSSNVIAENAVAELEATALDGDLHVYRRDGALVQAHLAELPHYSQLEHGRCGSLLDLLAEARESDAQARQTEPLAKRRNALQRRLAARENKLRNDLGELERKLREGETSRALRDEGQAIYETLHELPPQEQPAAKQRAAELFVKYKRSTGAIAHLQRRRAELLTAIEDVANLQWELERAEDARLEDVEEAIAALEPQRRSASKREPRRKRKPLRFDTPSGSRIYVGRTPIENAELTFRLARPNDLWFHVQSQPGAHVILQRGDRGQPPAEDLMTAAALAALHSKARNSPKVTVDYTYRKHVRKRPGAAPGLVYYSKPKTLYVEPGLHGQVPSPDKGTA